MPSGGPEAISLAKLQKFHLPHKFITFHGVCNLIGFQLNRHQCRMTISKVKSHLTLVARCLKKQQQWLVSNRMHNKKKTDCKFLRKCVNKTLENWLLDGRNRCAVCWGIPNKWIVIDLMFDVYFGVCHTVVLWSAFEIVVESFDIRSEEAQTHTRHILDTRHTPHEQFEKHEKGEFPFRR